MTDAPFHHDKHINYLKAFMANYFNRYFSIALELIAAYDGKQPLNFYLKKYFSLHKKYGSKDRKWITHFCYCYYRLGFALKEMNDDERLRVAIFLCSDKRGDWLSLYNENWQQSYHEELAERILFIQTLYPFTVETIFFNNDKLSNEIADIAFNQSHLLQPDLFIRMRPGKSTIVIDTLRKQNISFKQIKEDCLALDNSTKIDALIHLNKDAVVQDYSSQQIASLFPLMSLPKQPTIWDCCAASGGKSILAYDSFSPIKLTVSDIRESILHNLKRRFQDAGIQQYHSFVADVSSPQFLSKQQYDWVICDAPCSGSGTWGRTPEQLCFFTEQKLLHYAQLQKKVALNAAKAVKQNGYFLYITCSVFMQENEEVVKHIQAVSQLTLVKAEVIKGYDIKADTMFAALFVNS